MKIKSLLLCVLVIAFQSAYTQKVDAEKMAAYQTDTMATELQLDQKQKEQVAGINLEYAKKQSELMAREGSMFSKMGDMKKIRKHKNKALKRVLTEEQMEKYEDDIEPKIRKHMRKKMMG